MRDFHSAHSRFVATLMALVLVGSVSSSSALAEDPSPAADDPFSVLGFEKKPGEADAAPQGPQVPTTPAPTAVPSDTPVGPEEIGPGSEDATLRGDSPSAVTQTGPAANETDVKPQPTATAGDADLSIFGIDENHVGSSSQTVEQQRHRRVIQAILERLESNSQQVRLEAAVTLKETALPADVPMLAASLKNGGGIEKQVYIGEALGELHDVGATGALRNEVEHGEPASQVAATRALGKLGSDYPVPLLSGLMSKPDVEEVALSAIASLGRIGSTASIYALKNATGLALQGTRGRALKWALSRAEAKGVDETTTTELVQGRKIERFFKGTKYWIYNPDYRRKPAEKTWLLVCVHGSSLEVEPVFEACVEAGRKRQMAVVAPYFDYSEFPDYNDLNIRGTRADKRLLEILEDVSSKTDIMTRQIYMYGTEKGARFVHLFALAYPNKIARAALAYPIDANALPDYKTDLYFPDGLKTNPFAPDLRLSLEAAISLDLVLFKAGIDLRGVFQVDKFRDRVLSLSNQTGIKSRCRTASGSSVAEAVNFILSDN